MKKSCRTLIFVTASGLLAACSTTPSQLPALELDHQVITSHTGVAFLEPIALSDIPLNHFDPSFSLNIEMYLLESPGRREGAQVKPSFSTAEGSLKVNVMGNSEGYYHANWNPRDSRVPPQSLLRVEVRLDNTTTPGVAACMGEPKDLNAGCVAFFDVRLWANERQVRDSGEGILDWVMTSVLPIRFHIHKGAFGCLEPANLVHIPDTNLKAAFREALNKPSEDITCEDMQLLTGSFWAGGRSIVDLQGIQYARNLLLLDFSHNRIADLSPLADTNWPKLEVLYLNGNQLEDISPLADTNWPTLRWLYLDDNQISNVLPLAVSNWPHLMALSLINNQIGDPTPLKTLVNLIGLRLSGNEIRDVTSFANMTNLIELRLSHNQITDVSALSGKRFSDLHLDNNEITDLSNVDFYAAPMDRYPPSVFIGDLAGYLNLSSNQINDLTDSNLGGFQWTYLNHNQISNLANATIEGMYIHLSNNQLRTLSSEARIGSFDLYLDYNQLTDISAMVEGGWYNFRISVTNNCLDVSEGSQAREDFQALVDGGFTDHFVLYEPQRELTQPPCSN